MSSFSNYPNNSDYYLAPVIFIPSTLIITAISQSYPMNVTCTVPVTGANTYIPGQVVIFKIPYLYGMQQLNNMQGQITLINGLVFTININSSNFDSFSVPSGNVTEPASMVPAGSRNLEFNNSTNSIAFQPLNNVGN